MCQCTCTVHRDIGISLRREATCAPPLSESSLCATLNVARAGIELTRAYGVVPLLLLTPRRGECLPHCARPSIMCGIYHVWHIPRAYLPHVELAITRRTLPHVQPNARTFQ